MTTLYITTQGATVQKSAGQFVVSKSSEVLQNVPDRLVRQLVLVGNVNLSTPTVTYCLDKQIEVVFLSQGGRFRGRLNGDSSRAIEVRRRQYERSFDKDFCLTQARAFVAGKIQNQIAMVRQQVKNGSMPAEFGNLQGLLRRTGSATSVESLLGIEGSASATYFRMFSRWIPAPFTFTRRTSNPPRDEVNSILSLSYTLLYNRVASNLNLIGLDPYLGFFHKVQNGHAALASDLVEEFRAPFADALVLRLIRRKQLTPEHFGRENGRFTLTDAGKRIFFGEFENKLTSKRKTEAGDGWSLSYAQILERQARHFGRVIAGEEEVYRPFAMK